MSPDQLKTFLFPIFRSAKDVYFAMIHRSTEDVDLLLVPIPIEVFPSAMGLPVPSYHKLEHIYCPGQLKFFSPRLRGGTFLLISRWNLLLIKSANFRVHSGIQSPSTSTVRNFRFSLARFKKFE